MGKVLSDRLIFFPEHHLLIPRFMSDTRKTHPVFLKKGPPKAVRLFLSFNYKGDEFKNK